MQFQVEFCGQGEESQIVEFPAPIPASKVMLIDPSVEDSELDTARLEYYRAQRSAVSNLLKDSMISEEIHSQLLAEIDAAITQPQSQWSELLGRQNENLKPINRLIAAIVQEQDAESAVSASSKVSDGAEGSKTSPPGSTLRARGPSAPTSHTKRIAAPSENVKSVNDKPWCPTSTVPSSPDSASRCLKGFTQPCSGPVTRPPRRSDSCGLSAPTS